jgi:hypothetical protein
MGKIKEVKKNKEGKELIYYFSGLTIFFLGGVLLTYHPAYDYTLIKNLTGFLFCLLISVYYLLSRKEFEYSNLIYLPVIYFAWILISLFWAPFKYESAKNLENYILYFLIFITATNLKIDYRVFYIWIFSGICASIVGISQFYGERHYAISTFGNPNFYAGHIIMVLCISFSNLLNYIYRKENVSFLFILDILCLITGYMGTFCFSIKGSNDGFCYRNFFCLVFS